MHNSCTFIPLPPFLCLVIPRSHDHALGDTVEKNDLGVAGVTDRSAKEVGLIGLVTNCVCRIDRKLISLPARFR